jgi:hypothetical protein
VKQVCVPPEISKVFFNREAEAARLLAAIKERQSLLISGPAGIGKTRLIAEVIKSLPREQSESCIYLAAVAGLRPTLTGLLRNLWAREDPTLRRQMRADGFRSGDFKAWLKAQPSSHLKGTLYRSVERRSYWIFLDQVSVMTPPVAKVIRELVRMRDTPVYLVVRDLKATDAGHLLNLYWSEKHRVCLGPLPGTAARELLDSCVAHFGLSRLELSVFRPEVLRLSGRVPGAIVQMCALAAKPHYQSGLRPKTRLLHLDSLMRGYEKLPKPERGGERLSP